MRTRWTITRAHLRAARELFRFRSAWSLLTDWRLWRHRVRLWWSVVR